MGSKDNVVFFLGLDSVSDLRGVSGEVVGFDAGVIELLVLIDDEGLEDGFFVDFALGADMLDIPLDGVLDGAAAETVEGDDLLGADTELVLGVGGLVVEDCIRKILFWQILKILLTSFWMAVIWSWPLVILISKMWTFFCRSTWVKGVPFRPCRRCPSASWRSRTCS